MFLFISKNIIYDSGIKRRFASFSNKLVKFIKLIFIIYKRHKDFINKNFSYYTELIYKNNNYYIVIKIIIIILPAIFYVF